MPRLRWSIGTLLLCLAGIAGGSLAAQPAQAVPDLGEMLAKPQSELAIVVQRFDADRGSLARFYTIPSSPTRLARFKRFYTDWAVAVRKGIDVDKLSAPGQADWKALQKKIDSGLEEVEATAKAQEEIAALVPFAPAIVALEEARQQMSKMDAAKSASVLHAMKQQIHRLQKALAKTDDKIEPGFEVTEALAKRAADTTGNLRAALKHWFGFYNGYDPMVTWWTTDLYKEVDGALQEYTSALRKLGPGATVPVETAIVAKVGDASNHRPAFPGTDSDAPDLRLLMALHQSELREVVQRYQADRQKIGGRLGGLPGGKGPKTPESAARLKQFSMDWLAALDKLDFDKLSQEGKVDYLLLKNHLNRELRRIEVLAKAEAEAQDKAAKDPSGIVGRPIGRDSLLVELAGEMIAHSPEELLEIADKEYAWCEAEMKKASRQMGFGEDWMKAVEKVKTLHVDPGQQPAMIRDLAWEAVEYLQQHDLVTVPALAQETWRMEMMSPERQLVNPFFTGGEVISVSFPTSGMSLEAKLQSMRGNNLHFARATVHHELMPGHHLQIFSEARWNSHRRAFGTPFWLEGWALYWEMVLYDKGFAKTPEDRVGFLVWRMHRCARIHFSLNYHLGKLTPTECIDYLVRRVGFDPANATAEVRRSLQGNYGPLYQAAYMLGGLQFRALRRELVESGKMKERVFHDAILQGHSMPIEMVRALVGEHKLTRDFTPAWKFYQ
jgi:uncharacterized protein (DUF885 family)